MSGTAPGAEETVDPARRLGPVVRLAPAKVNLTLAVLGRRPDGYHDLHSVMAPVDVTDRLSVAIAPPRAVDSLHVAGRDAGPIDENLVIRAIGAAREAARPAWAGPGVPPPLAARLEKRIPVAAGLGGGSSDAAAAIEAALEAWGVDLEPPAVRAVAASIGSDVPFFLAGGPALVEGRGERVTPLPWIRDRSSREDGPALLLVTPGLALPTRDVFAAFAAGARSAGGVARLASEHLASELRAGLDLQALMARASVLAAANDLAAAAAAVAPAIVAFTRALRRLIRRPVAMSGSGPTLWALYPSHREASLAANMVRDAWLTGTLAVPGEEPPFVAAARIARVARREP